MKKFIYSLLIVVLLVGCNFQGDKNNKSDALLFKEEYESLNNKKTNYNDTYYRTLDIKSDNPFIYKEASDILEMIDNEETFVVYFGFSDCPWCRSIVPNLIDAAKELNVLHIYYVDIKEIRNVLKIDDNGNVITSKKGTDDYYELLEELNLVLDSYTLVDNNGVEIDTGEKRIYAPNIISVVDGVAVNMTTGISDRQIDANMELDDEMNKESYDKIKCAIECVVEEKAVCTSDRKC